MSFYQEKYLKYKTKYLALKNQMSNNIQMGGSGKKMNTSSNFYNINNIELLTETPSMIDVYGYELKGGHNTVARIANYKKLANLLSDTEMSQSAGQPSETTAESPATESPTTESSATEPSATESSATESSTAESSATESPATESPADEPSADESPADEPSADESPADESSDASKDQEGGAKKSKKTKKQKRNFFEDSDLDSTTTDSDLSTLSTDDTSDNTDSDYKF
jgi:hypothetical protein